jgi:heat shock protein HtpX
MSVRTRHKLLNLVHSAVLIIGMGLIAALCTWALWGAEGVLWTAIGAALAMALSPSVPSGFVLALHRARPLAPAEMPGLHAALAEMSRRADLPVTPRLYYMPSAVLNAFALGSRNSAAIAVSDGMLRTLSFREIANVLAHEVSHIANGDLWIMGLAELMNRVAAVMSNFGMFLLILNVPLIAAGAVTVPWLLVLPLVLAPSLMGLLQLALARAREFDADLGAASLTGDPEGLAAALAKLERHGRLWERMLLPSQRAPGTSLLRTHPSTSDRIRRLLELAPPQRGAYGTFGRDIGALAGAGSGEGKWLQ